MRSIAPAILITIVLVSFAVLYMQSTNREKNTDNLNETEESQGGMEKLLPHPLSIEVLREGEYPGSDIVIEQTLSAGVNYQRYIVSYKSEGLKIYALLTIPNGQIPLGGWPAIIFNHGYIPPTQYKTTERYIAYTDAFSSNDYVLLRPDYRGHGNSEGQASGGYGSNGYTIDVLNAVASIKKYPGVNPEKIGMWGHSMGGHITLRNMVVNKDIKAGVIWAGVVASYPDLVERWRRRSPSPSVLPGNVTSSRGGWRQTLIEEYGQPHDNPEFWNSLSANSYLKDISGPLALHHGSADTSVPLEFSQKLENQMKEAEKEVELYIYQGDDHNLGSSLSLALQRSVDFFNKHLK